MAGLGDEANEETEEDMSNKMTYAIIATLLVWFWTAVFWAVWVFAKPTPVKWDCSMAEFHADIPADVKKQCRKLRQSA